VLKAVDGRNCNLITKTLSTSDSKNPAKHSHYRKWIIQHCYTTLHICSWSFSSQHAYGTVTTIIEIWYSHRSLMCGMWVFYQRCNAWDGIPISVIFRNHQKNHIWLVHQVPRVATIPLSTLQTKFGNVYYHDCIYKSVRTWARVELVQVCAVYILDWC